MADNVQNVYVATSSDAVASNGLTGPILVHKIVLQNSAGNASNLVAVSLFDALTATGTAKIVALNNLLATGIWENQRDLSFDPPIRFQIGIATSLTGNGAIARVYWTR